MGTRNIKRQIAKGRLAAIGVKNVGKKVGAYGKDGRKAWKAAISGKTGDAAEFAQIDAAIKKAQVERSKKSIARRVLKKV